MYIKGRLISILYHTYARFRPLQRHQHNRYKDSSSRKILIRYVPIFLRQKHLPIFLILMPKYSLQTTYDFGDHS